MRPSLESLIMEFAQSLSRRSKDSNLKVAAVVTDQSLNSILGFGWNGGAKGQSDERASNEPGQSELIHAEINALIKTDYSIPNKIMFLTHSPCVVCAKIMINAGISKVYYKELYRDDKGLQILKNAGIVVSCL